MRNLLVLILAVGAWPVQGAATPDLARKVDALVAPFMQQHTFSGVILVARGDEMLVQKGYGKANVEFGVPNAPDTRFPIASISKKFTTVIVRQLEAEKKLSLADPLSKWVPDFPSADKITVDHLLRHHSGIQDPEKLRRVIRLNLTTADVVDQLKTEPLASVPGETYSYTTANFSVLAHIIERVTGKSFATVVRERIYEPAKMTDSGDLVTTTVVPRLASGYMPDPFGKGLSVCGPEDTSWKAAGGSGYATARDLHRFHLALFDGRLIPKDVKPADYVSTSKFLERTAFRSSGAFPGANANAMYFPDERVSVIVLSNNYSPVTGTIAEQIARAYFGMPVQPVAAPTLARGVTPHPSMAGRWEIEGAPWSFNLAIRDGAAVLVWSDIRQGALLATADGSWFTPFDWATLTFDKDGTGNVTGGSMTASWLEKPAKLIRAAAKP